MKFRRAIIYLLCVFAACIFAGSLAGCASGGTEYEGFRVVYELEGGVYKNSSEHVQQFYHLGEGASSLLTLPSALSGQEITRPNYHIVQWCRTKNEDGTYSDPWDFSSDKITEDMGELTLWCVWAKNIVYSYDVYFWEDFENRTGETYVGRNVVNEGDPFSKNSTVADDRAGFTAERALNEQTGKYEILYYDETGAPWDFGFTHPGGETDTAVKVFVKYIEGDFVYVTNAKELNAAASKGNGVWLCNDIDFADSNQKPGTINQFKDGTGGFRSVFYGNGFTISNCVMSYSDANYDLLDGDFANDSYDVSGNILVVSMFGKSLSGAKIENVTFENVSVDIKTTNRRIAAIYLAPFAVTAEDSTVEGVAFTGTFTVSGTPRGFEDSMLRVTADRLLAQEGFETNCTVNVTYTDSRS